MVQRVPGTAVGVGHFLTTVVDFRGWDVRELAWLPRRFRDGAGVTFGTQQRSIFGPKLVPTGPQNDSNDLDCVKNEHETSIVSRMNTIALDTKTKMKNLKLNLKPP